MSKVVKSVTRAVSKVVSGASKLVSGVLKGATGLVQKIANSKLGKILIAAAAIYFGGAALMGGLQGAAAGSGFWGTISSAVQGAGTGIANAWTSLSAATGSALSGNFAQAGSQLGAGIQGTTLASQVAPTVGAATAAAPIATTGAATAAPAAAAPAATAAATSPTGLFGSELAKYGMVTGGMQLAGGMIQGYGQQKAMEDQRVYEEEQARLSRERANTNMMAQFSFDGSGATGATAPSGTGGTSYANYPSSNTPSQMAQINPALYAPTSQQQLGLITNAMNQGVRAFPTYNPTLSRYGYV